VSATLTATSAPGDAIGTAAPAQNTVLPDLVEAVATYPQTYLTVQIHDVEADGGSAINEGDDVTFRVRVHNAGPLDVTELTLLIEARAGATGVKLHGGTAFSPTLTSAVFPLVPGHQGHGQFVGTPDDHYHLKAGAAGDDEIELVRASVSDWNANLNHILTGHSDPVPAVGDTYSHRLLRR
jgi:hypothetical protein